MSTGNLPNLIHKIGLDQSVSQSIDLYYAQRQHKIYDTETIR